MRRIVSKTQLIAMLVLVCLAGQTVATAAASGASTGTGGAAANKAAIDKAVQEALAKAQAGKSAGGAGTSSEAGRSPESFSSLTRKAEEEEPTGTTQKTATTSTPTSSGSLSTGLLVPVFIVVAGLLAGIAFLILRDARGVAPAGDVLPGAGNAEARAARLRKRRAKAKAAKRQRKRNR